jgi:hypothetical protein
VTLKPLPVVAAALALSVVAAFVVTGISLVPPSVALGPCLKDWTSLVSYRPRASALGSLRFRVSDAELSLCYGRPVRRDRTVFGGLVPYGSLWRLGANEPTRLSITQDITLAGIPLRPGRYSLYALPRPDTWTVYVSRSTLHWGNDISAEVRSQEVGQVVVPAERLAEPVETLTVRVEDHGSSDQAELVFEWERTRIALDVARAGAPSNLGVHP